MSSKKQIVDYFSTEHIDLSFYEGSFYLEVSFGGPSKRWRTNKVTYETVAPILKTHINKKFYFNGSLQVIYTDLFNPNVWV